MKKLGVIGIVIVLALTAVVAGTAGAKSTPEIGDVPEAYNLNLIFDGYCDGMSGPFDPATGLFAGTYTSTCATCPFTDQVGGTIAKVYGAGQGNALTVSFASVQGTYPVWFWTVIRFSPKTWTHYYFDGTVMNSGTWTKCPPPGEVVPGTRPSTAR
jgi:hypothetical protein